jgi:L,D-transpeptidase catalytic domain
MPNRGAMDGIIAAYDPSVIAAAVATAALAVAHGPAQAPAIDHRPAPARILWVRKGRHVRLRRAPGGRTIAILGDRTEYGRRTILAVTHVRGRWAAVSSSLVPNGRRAWVRLSSRDVAFRHTRWRLEADLTDRVLTVLHDGERVTSFAVTIGRRGTESPTGRFAISDKLAGKDFGRSFGCCILALSGRQPKVTFDGLDGRMAIHGTDRPRLIGHRDSQGCLRASDQHLRMLMRRVPVGTPVIIRR